jgi:hypothetical protein
MTRAFTLNLPVELYDRWEAAAKEMTRIYPDNPKTLETAIIAALEGMIDSQEDCNEHNADPEAYYAPRTGR